MSVLRRIFGLDVPAEDKAGDVARVVETEQELTAARQEFRQSIQRVQSGAKVFQTTAGAMRMINNARGESC